MRLDLLRGCFGQISQSRPMHWNRSFEALEGRLLLTAAQTRPDYMISTAATDQVAPAVALADNGDFVAAWSGSRTDLVNNVPVTHTDPYFRRYSANGLAKDAAQVDVFGAALNVNNQNDVHVAVDPSGNFVVAWTDIDSAADSDIFFQRFDAAGIPQGAPTRANTTNADTTNQDEPAIGIAGNGDFTITWTHHPTGGNTDIFFRRFFADGTPKSLTDSSIVASANAKSQSDVAVADFGNIVITWTEQSGADNNVFVKGFLANGNVFLTQTQVNTTDLARSQSNSSVAIDGRGFFDVVWQDAVGASNHDIRLQQFTDVGVRLSPVDIPLVQTSDDETSPQIGAAIGQFVVAWQDNNGATQQTRYQLFADGGIARQAVTTFGTSFATLSADAAMDPAGEFAIVVQHPTNVQSLIQGLNYRDDQHTPGLYDPQTALFRLRDSNTSGPADLTFAFTGATDTLKPMSGDWNGDGFATVGLYDQGSSLFYLTNSTETAVTQIIFAFGPPNGGWLPISGDWNGDGRDSVGLYDPLHSIFYLADDNFVNQTPIAIFGFGAPNAGWLPITGNWNGSADRIDKIGLYDFNTSVFYLRNSNTSGTADLQVGFGAPGVSHIPVVGDWDNDANHTTTVGIYTPSSSIFNLRNSNTTGFADLTFGFGPPFGGWLPLADHWQPGADTIALYDATSTTFFKRFSNSTGFADATQAFGPVTVDWKPLAGDWNYDGVTTVGLFDPTINVFYLRDFNSTGPTTAAFLLSGAPAGSIALSGDWNGDGFDTVGLYDPATEQFFLKNSNVTGNADMIFTFQGALSSWLPIAGDFDGDGSDSVGLYDPVNSVFYLRNENSTGAAEIVAGFGQPGGGLEANRRRLDPRWH